MLLADIARHASNAYAMEGKVTYAQSRALIRKRLEEFWPESMDDEGLETRVARKQ